MADDAARLLTDDEFRRRVGRDARESAISRYRTELVIPRYLEFYERVIGSTKNQE